MTMSPLAGLIGHCLTGVERVHDYVQLRFDNGDLLNVFNEFRIEGNRDADITVIVGLVVNVASTGKDEVCLRLGSKTFRISLLDSAYRGPEAIEYVPVSGNRVVWS